MGKTVLIVEKDVALMRAMRDSLKDRGFDVSETTDGKSVPDVVKRTKPDCVVLAVDLDAGQNGYILCKKLKSDDDLKKVPILIVGDPKGFGPHQKLKTRAEDYLGKPFEAPSVVDRVGALAGFPPEPPLTEAEFDTHSLMQESADEISLENAAGDETVGSSDPDFEMVDAMFDSSKSSPPPPPAEEIQLTSSNDDFSEEPERTMIGISTVPVPTPSARPAQPKKEPERKPVASSSLSGIGGDDLRQLRAKVAELTDALEDANRRATEFEDRARDLENQLDAKGSELEAAKSTGGKSDKDLFTLRDSVNKKDKEILRLKNELNEKEKEIVELREKENSLDQQVSESSGELARKDAQIKTLQTKADQLSAERKRVDQQLLQVKEEARSASSKLGSLQTDFDAIQPRVQELEQELEGVRNERAELDLVRQQAESDLAESRGEVEALKVQLDDRSREADEARSLADQAQIDLEAARNQVSSQAQAFADEIGGLRQRVADLETTAQRHEDRANRQTIRLKSLLQNEEEVRGMLEQALGALKREGADTDDEIDIDELAEA